MTNTAVRRGTVPGGAVFKKILWRTNRTHLFNAFFLNAFHLEQPAANKIQAQEERDHALLFYQYLHNNNETVTLEAIAKPDPQLVIQHIQPFRVAAKQFHLCNQVVSGFVRQRNRQRKNKKRDIKQEEKTC